MLNGSVIGLTYGLFGVILTGLVVDAFGTPYFPPPSEQPEVVCPSPGGVYRTVTVDGIYADWFGNQLQAAEEPSLYLASLAPQDDRPDVLRFSWLRSFDPVITVRIVHDASGTATLVAKELVGDGGYESRGIARSVGRQLTAEELDGLRAVMAREPFSGPSFNCDFMPDGSRWLLEDVSADGYRVTNQWSPEDGAVREVGLYLLGLTGWDLQQIY